ncbi:MAG: TonB-dependent receptor [Sphingomicrobium sp.]
MRSNLLSAPSSRSVPALLRAASLAAIAVATSSTAALAQTATTEPQPRPTQSTQPQPSATTPDQTGITADPATPVEVQSPAAPSNGNEVVVTGFRGSLRSALNEKRRSNVQVDVINAEDIADFPDANLAESLQRLPGVSIDRDNGEGRSITVRGLGGDFNRTRINGLEALSTAGANDAGSSPNRSRSFDYNTFASELFSSLKVQKTASAETDEGSLGATIDLQTGRPFDYKKSTIAVSTEGSYQKNSKEWSPRIAGLASTRFMDGKMGLLVSVAYSKSFNEVDQYFRQAGQSDYLYRGADFLGNELPARGGFSAPVGATFTGPTSATNPAVINQVTNPTAVGFLTGSDPTAYANLYPGSPYSTPGRFDDSLVRIPALATLQQQDVRYRRLGLTAAYQWQVSDRTRLSIDGLMSNFHNVSTNNQISSVGLNRNNTNATYNTASNSITPVTSRGLYPGTCSPNAGSDIIPAQDCGQALYGTTPVFSTARSSSNATVASILGAGAVVPGGTTASNANIFSVNPNNLDPYDYYNNPGSVGYIPSTNRTAFRGELIGRPAVDVLQSHVTDGVADYLVLRNVDFRSAADQSDYTTKFRQGSINLTQEFTDNLKGEFIYGRSKSKLFQQGLLVEFNRMDSPGSFVYDERGGGDMPVIDFGFDAANPSNWQTVKGFSGIRHYQRFVTNTYRTIKADFDWAVNDRFNIAFGGTRRKYGFKTEQFERNNDLLNPTLREAGANLADMGRVIDFGQGLDLPEGTATSFFVPTISSFQNLFDFTCNCINKWGDWRLTNLRNGGRENFSVSETDTGYYGQIDWKTELFGRTFRGNIGTRVAKTDVVSNGTTTAGRPLVGTNKYTDWLPSVNLVYEPMRDVLVRFGASKVMARPLLGNLSPSVTAVTIPNTGDTSAFGALTVGNPKLKPFYARNMDASVEWYFRKGSLFSLALFNKKIQSFPQTVSIGGPLSSFLDQESRDALLAQFVGTTPAIINQQNFIISDGTVIARQYRDAPGGYLRGFEANLQFELDFLPGYLDGFGVLLNYTYIKSKLKYIVATGSPATNTSPAVAPSYGTAPFLNVSPRALNGTLYYEKGPFKARVSVARRKGYSTTYPLAAGTCAPGILSQTVPGIQTYCSAPLVNDFIFSGATSNVDFAASYQVTRYFSVTVEGLNLTNQTSNRYAYQDNPVVTQYASSGPVYRVGARLKF